MPDGIIDRRLKKPIKQGQPFLTTDFYLEGTGPSIAKMLQPGFRAIRVQVPDTREAGVQPGMYVDVMFRANARPAKAGQLAIPEKTLTLLRHIEVLEAERPTKATDQRQRQQKTDVVHAGRARGEGRYVRHHRRPRRSVAGAHARQRKRPRAPAWRSPTRRPWRSCWASSRRRGLRPPSRRPSIAAAS